MTFKMRNAICEIAKNRVVGRLEGAGVTDASAPAWQTPAFFVCGGGAYVAYLAWFFSMFAHFGGPVGLEYGAFGSYLLQMGFFATLALGMVGAWLFSDTLSSVRGTLALALGGTLLCPCATIAALVACPYPVVLAAWCASGLGCACVMMLVASFLGSLEHRYILLCTSTSFALALLLYLLVAFLSPNEMKAAVVSLMPFAACALLLHVHSRYLDPQVPLVEASESRLKNRMSWKSMGASCGHSLCLGFAVYCTVVVAEGFSMWALVAVGLAAFAAAVLMALDGHWGLEMLNSEGMQLKFFLPSAALGLLPMPFLGAAGQAACCCVLFLVFVPQAITNINAVSENVRIFGLAPIRSFAGARVANVMGLGAGYTMGFFAYGRGLGQGMASSLAVLLVLLFVLIVIAAFLFQDRYPSEASEAGVEDDAEREEERLSWRERCNLLAGQIGLSPRQTEVLVLLSRGHNTKYIEEQLVISNHTAKSHIYHIYQKAGVHSKQEIIEMLERIGSDDQG